MDIMEQIKTNFIKVAENTTKVYQAGYDKGKSEGGGGGTEGTYEDGYDTAMTEICNAVQNNGKRSAYMYTFSGWDLNSLKYLKYDIKPTASCQRIFENTTGQVDLTTLFNEINITLDTIKSTSTSYMFYRSEVVRVPIIDNTQTLNSRVQQTFFYCPYLETVDEFILKNDGSQDLSDVFTGCTSLKNIIITGVIGYTGFNISASKVLTKDSLLSVLQAFKVTGKTISVTLPKYCIDGATDTLITIQNDTELNTAYTNALANGYTITFK